MKRFRVTLYYCKQLIGIEVITATTLQWAEWLARQRYYNHDIEIKVDPIEEEK